jgi:hypothetical protein
MLAGMPTYITMIPIVLLIGGMFAYVEYKTIGFVVKSPNRTAARLLRPTLKCVDCGQLGPAGDICKRCKAQLPTHDMGEKRRCYYCRTMNNPGATVCSSCRASLLLHGNGRQANIRPHFVKISKSGEEIVFVLDRPTITIGQTLDNDFVLEDESVSHRHARIVWHPMGIHVVQDLSSINGTFVNGQRVNESLLQNGYEVRFGQMRLVYRAAHYHNVQHQPPQGRAPYY